VYFVETIEPNLVAGMQRLSGVYTQSFNRRQRRVGHLFQGRYKAILVDKDGYRRFKPKSSESPPTAG
jgi:REP-associated tyrosine transposase